jgi:hypothetical protein
MRLARSLSAVALAVCLAAGACGGSGGGTADPAVTTAPPAASGDAPVDGGTATSGRVSANDASREELAAALDAAGVPQAERWADEIVEYRPYPADDPAFARLRDELAKYDPSPELVDQIVAVLEP